MEDKEKVEIETVSIQDSDEPKSEQKSEPENSATEETAKNEEVERLKQQLAEMKDKYLRTAAELENTRRRSSLDIESAARNRSISVAKKFLPVMDAVEAALKLSPDDEGIKSMAKAMESAFAQIGISKIESVGKILNPQFHNAIQVIATPEDAANKPAPNTILEEMQPGYMFGDTVMRTAMVIVSK